LLETVVVLLSFSFSLSLSLLLPFPCPRGICMKSYHPKATGLPLFVSRRPLFYLREDRLWIIIHNLLRAKILSLRLSAEREEAAFCAMPLCRDVE